ncbi:MAG TPA: MerC domain-containing protein, partial [Puia sp.]|nr:MerC domain-containing protein [Puia sp.]
WDALGISTSIACAIHCAVLPLVTATLPVLGVNIIHNVTFEYGMIALAFVIGLRALLHGYRRFSPPARGRRSTPLSPSRRSFLRRLAESRRMPILLFAGGIAVLLAKQLWRQYELQLLPFAILLIGWAHIANFRLSRRPVGAL